MTKRSSIFLYLVAMILLATWALLPASATYRAYNLGHLSADNVITIFSPFVDGIIFLVPITVGALFSVLFLASFWWPIIKHPRIAALVAVVAVPCAVITYIVISALNLDVTWTLHGRVTDSAGQSYVFCNESFLGSRSMTLTRVESEDWLVMRLKIMETNSDNSPPSWASVVRPANPRNTFGQLYLTDQQILVGISCDNKCCLAYDLASKKSYGHWSIERVSPFICLNADDELHTPDIDAILKRIREGIPQTSGYPDRASVESALKHPNPRVKDVAKSLLKCLPKQATRPVP